MTRSDIKEITDTLTSVLLRKNEDYGGASFDLGLNGNMVHLWDKVSRYRHLVENTGSKDIEPNFESIEDTLFDIMGYALIGLLILKEDNGNN